ncbi:MAG: SRPBCC family protein [Bdellovibrionales bacterium]|nr:SRPBCC family protein [Bdellovibrionales bacterium]
MSNRDPDFVYVTYIKTTPEKLWEALTSSTFTRQYWFGCEVTSDWKVGSPMTYVMNGEKKVEGKVLVADRPKLLSYTFREAFGESAKEPPTKVTLELEPEAGTETVRLTVTHTDFIAGSKHRPSISGGWPAVLSNLKSFLETGKTLEFEM